MSEAVHEDGVTPVTQEDWDDLLAASVVYAMTVKDENAAALKAIAECATWRQRAEEAEEVVGTLQLHNERLREALHAPNGIDYTVARQSDEEMEIL